MSELSSPAAATGAAACADAMACKLLTEPSIENMTAYCFSKRGPRRNATFFHVSAILIHGMFRFTSHEPVLGPASGLELSRPTLMLFR